MPPAQPATPLRTPIPAPSLRSWWQAWETVVLLLIGEGIDPDEYITGAYLTDKHTRGSVSLRLEIWFSTEDEVGGKGCRGEPAAAAM